MWGQQKQTQYIDILHLICLTCEQTNAFCPSSRHGATLAFTWWWASSHLAHDQYSLSSKPCIGLNQMSREKCSIFFTTNCVCLPACRVGNVIINKHNKVNPKHDLREWYEVQESTWEKWREKEMQANWPTLQKERVLLCWNWPPNTHSLKSDVTRFLLSL